MRDTVRIAVDLMGSDRPPELVLEGIHRAVDQLSPLIKLTVVGEKRLFENQAKQKGSLGLVTADGPIFMDEPPLYAIRKKQNSSMMTALRLLRDGKVDAVVSAGNTGALVAGASLILHHIDEIGKPALLAMLPTNRQPMAVLDVGGNIYYTAEDLLKSALIGVAYQTSVQGLGCPKVGLLNIGTESAKGTAIHQEAYQRLSALQSGRFLFVGNIEGREAFEGKVDVLVADAFSGNIFLKTAEGVSISILESLEHYLQKNCPNYDVPEFSGAKACLQERFDYANHPGAVVCGIQGVVVKCHGSFKESSLLKSISSACNLVEKRFISDCMQFMKAFPL